MSRALLIAMTAACVAFAPAALAQGRSEYGTSGPPSTAKTTTVKSSKSNTSDRQGVVGPTGLGGPSQTNLNSSRSNVNRMGGGGGAR